MNNILIGIDTGGTFTDFVLVTEEGVRAHKTLSTPDAPEQAIVSGLRELGIAPHLPLSMMHGTTIATNAVLQGRGAKTAYITNYGFADTLTIGRQTRSELYNLKPAAKTIPVMRELCFETGGRITPQGEVLEELDAAQIVAIRRRLKQMGAQSVAVNLLFSFIDSHFEEEIERALQDDFFVSRSSALHPAPGEYERGIVTWLNARLIPLIDAYLKKLGSALPAANIRVMQSNGHTIASQQAAKRSVNLLLSGPAGGVIGAKHVADMLGEQKMLAFDMGGTSTDVAIIDGDIALTGCRQIGCWPVTIPMADIRTIGAGGGSIAFADEAGLLRLGPESAGSMPGPACYGRGGEKPTVTDANLILGHIPTVLQNLTLDMAKAEAAFRPLCAALGIDRDEAADGVIKLANEQMVQALRKTLAAKACSGDAFLLCGFGAAAGLHICALADGLNIKRAIIPAYAGVLSALGMLTARKGLYRTHTVCAPIDGIEASAIAAIRQRLERQVASAMRAQQIAQFELRYSCDLRYLGQLFCLTLPWQGPERTQAAFHRMHEQRYGHRLDAAAELVSLRLEAHSEPEITFQEALGKYQTSARANERFEANTVISDANCTTWVAQNWRAQRDSMGNLRLRRNESARARATPSG